MKVTFSFVPPGGGEQDYSLEFDLPAIPQPGDYIRIMRDDKEFGHPGEDCFLVRRTWWYLQYSDNGGRTREIVVEAEFAEGPYDSESHKSSIQMYANRGKEAKTLDASTY